MSTGIPIGQPPSPPHSSDGATSVSEVKPHLAHMEPYTPPRSIRPAPCADSSLVSQPLPNRESGEKANEDLPSKDPYGDPSLYHTAPSQAYYMVQPVSVRPTRYHTPPAAIPDSGIKTRSGRALRSPSATANPEASRPARSPRPKKNARAVKGAKAKGPIIDQPLSELTKDYKIPVKDMKAWVYRSVEDRMKEVDKKKGYIPRPMNSFMLYRSAYAERVKQFCKENNHQIVSQVTGASWPMEPKEIQDMYGEFARIERDNHHNAHPNYKFAPNKNTKKRAQTEEDDRSDEDPDWERALRNNKRSRSRRPDGGRSLSSTPFEADVGAMGHHPLARSYPPPMLHPSSYHAVNPHGAPPMVVGPDGLAGQYYQTTVTPYGQHVDDVKFGKMENPFPHFDLSWPLVGMPHGNHNDLLGLPSATSPLCVELQGVVDMVDPRLAQYDPNLQYAQYEGFDQGYEVVSQNYDYSSYPTATAAATHAELAYAHEHSHSQGTNYHPGLATLTDGREVWTEAGQAGSDFDEEFRKWN